MTFYIYSCVVNFYVFFIDEICVVGPKIVYKHILIGNVQVRLHVGPTRGPRGGPYNLRLEVAWQPSCSAKRRPKRCPINETKADRLGVLMEPEIMKMESLQEQTTKPH